MAGDDTLTEGLVVIRGLAGISLAILLVLAIIAPVGLQEAEGAYGLQLKVGFYENPPKIYHDEVGNDAGFWPDILGYIAESEGWTIDYIDCAWTECLGMLGTGEIDVMPDVAFTGERNLSYEFSNETVFVSWARVYSSDDLNIETITDLSGLRIAVMNGSVYTNGSEGIVGIVESYDVEAEFLYFDDYSQVFKAIDEGKADAGIVNRIFGKTNEDKYNVRETPITFSPTDLMFAFPKGAPLNDILIPTIDKYIVDMKADPDSVYYKALEEHFAMGSSPTDVKVVEKLPAWVPFLLVFICGAVASLSVAAVGLKRTVRRRTADLRRANWKLGKNHAFISSVLDNADVLIMVTDKKGRIEVFNKKCQELTGRSEKEMCGTSALRVLRPLNQSNGGSSHEETWEMTFKGSRFMSRIVGGDGKRKVVAWSVTPLDNGVGDIKGRILLGTDITDLLQMEKDISRLKDVEETNRAKDEFLARMSHDLRTPLNGIIGYTELLIDKQMGDVNEKQMKYLNTINHSSNTLLKLINDILEMSRINSNKVTFKMREFDVVSVVKSTVDTLAPMASKKGHKLGLDIKAQNVIMTSDPDKVEEILLNIIGNAIKYTPKDGTISVNIDDGGLEMDGMVVISVKDNGIGIPKEDLDKIFEMFWRVETSVGAEEEGTGLGLTISQKLAQGLGGKISVKSEFGVGSMFYLQLPKMAKQGD